jgi:hypothetical protein
MHYNIIQQIRKLVDLNESEVDIFNKYVETQRLKKKQLKIKILRLCSLNCHS